MKQKYEYPLNVFHCVCSKDERLKESNMYTINRKWSNEHFAAGKPFPSMQRRQPVTSRGEELLTPLQVACDELGNKAKHLRRILDAVEPGRPLDVKRLQLLLQGAVQPTVCVEYNFFEL